ncbi:hypothetical protein LZ31DRAFT_245516 [Colletotrichum somersetense]|nr:hypothetical protein LZ31DRAFT_245516 [Colletotrichum somersetense]
MSPEVAARKRGFFLGLFFSSCMKFFLSSSYPRSPPPAHLKASAHLLWGVYSFRKLHSLHTHNLVVLAVVRTHGVSGGGVERNESRSQEEAHGMASFRTLGLWSSRVTAATCP